MNSDGPVFVLGSFVAALSMKVAHLPAAGESLRGEALLLEAGGKGLNVAIALRRLGLAVDGLIAIGSDHFAAMAQEALARADLPEGMLVGFPGPSGTGVGLIDAHGENMIAVFPGANGLLSAREVAGAEARIGRSRAVVAQYEIGDAPIAVTFATARTWGVRTVLNPSPYRPIAAEILAATDVLVLNETEAKCLLAELAGRRGVSSGQVPAALAEALAGSGVESLVVTLGCEGAVLRQRDGRTLHQAAFAVEAKDATGCGDAFLAGLVAALSSGDDWAGALRFASACGAITCSRIGVIDALPTRPQVVTMITGERPSERIPSPQGA
ncbi:ribokinase [Sphingomonas sp. AP4-R1]|uniref:ribokinase n=1 Tax=Sphingomonas sp. AP4-R1 TaxID=2735134 RepID=UPI00149365F8|nr:ribokinase [Sphingomonas sp. AP4-R1]QJU56564.1 ribokinase [Sphingomonas sp. AP4-R1]